jgi:hypothetical protein
MSRLVIIRVGDPDGLWAVCKPAGKWSSPECHEQCVRNMIVEGYSVYAIFVGTGDRLLMATKIISVRERLTEDDTVIPDSNDIGLLRTTITFDPVAVVELKNMICHSYTPALDYIQYKIGSQIVFPGADSENILKNIISLISLSRVNTVYRGNYTMVNPEYWINLNVHGC